MKKEDLLKMDDLALKSYIQNSGPYRRLQIAKMGVGLDMLASDKRSFVRQVVARHGVALDKLVSDKVAVFTCWLVGLAACLFVPLFTL